eukprot:9475132-Pyramimonas_sp.AAC.2
MEGRVWSPDKRLALEIGVLFAVRSNAQSSRHGKSGVDDDCNTEHSNEPIFRFYSYRYRSSVYSVDQTGASQRASQRGKRPTGLRGLGLDFTVVFVVKYSRVVSSAPLLRNLESSAQPFELVLNMSSGGDRYSFLVDWLDPNAQIVWKYQLLYYPSDGSVEMYDIKNRRSFLKRTHYPSVILKDLYVGSTVTVYSRQLKVVDYADPYTRGKLESTRERFMPKPIVPLGCVY